MTVLIRENDSKGKYDQASDIGYTIELPETSKIYSTHALASMLGATEATNINIVS